MTGTDIIGRDQECEQLATLLSSHRVVTLVGPGGIGKTSAALAVSWEVIDGRPVTFVDLARVEDPLTVPERLAEAIDRGLWLPRSNSARARIEGLRDPKLKGGR